MDKQPSDPNIMPEIHIIPERFRAIARAVGHALTPRPTESQMFLSTHIRVTGAAAMIDHQLYEGRSHDN